MLRIIGTTGCGILLFCTTFPETAGAQKSSFDVPARIIVLDPGHGGHDAGAQGPDGTLEKALVLILAEMIASDLYQTGRVTLTRTDDYWLDIPLRTSAANHLKADLFISLHAGGSFLHRANGITIYYYKDYNPQPTLPETFPSNTPWRLLQNKHAARSRLLAETIQTHLSSEVKFLETRLQNAPLLVLEGADMPAVLIETGYLTNPSEEKALEDPDVLAKLASAVSAGISDFLSRKSQ